jgi:nitroreductase
MRLSELIQKRVSVNKFNEKKVDLELIKELLDVAVYAPNHKMREPWRFVLLEGEGKKKFVSDYINQLSDLQKEESMQLLSKVFQAPLVVVFIMPVNKDFRDELEDLQAVAAVIQNYLLLSTEANLATSWKTPKYIESEIFKEVIGCLPNEIVVGMIMTGYSDLVVQPKPRKKSDVLVTVYK